ncbi:zinc ABC transporter substrate-binding protein [Thioalkalicoccus limnaeus]|uniref:Zinc ABC transporter substrate-binding protein n=1 Tax=Thioalkalicoccus limnaeus TaxID=120681 RepID=A0ABV4BIT9_9GAMM
MRFLLHGLLLSALLLGVAGCETGGEDDDRLRVVATTNIIGDLVRTIGGDDISLASLMGPGIDPHLYRASEGDAHRMSRADIVFYNGHHLEGRMTDLFEQMGQRGVRTEALAEVIPDGLLISSPDYPGHRDPHVWLDVSLWQIVAEHVRDVLVAMDPDNAEGFRARTAALLDEMAELDSYLHERASAVPDPRRVLLTSHDAFKYFGKAYGFDVRGLQGISTATEAGTADVQRMAEFIVERQIPVLFAESSVPERGIEAVRRAAQAKGFNATLGGTLYGDALGDRGTPEGTYIGMMRHNIDTIVEGLLRDPN